MIIDLYTHILPDRFFREMSRVSPKLENIGARLRGVKKLFDLDARFAEMDTLGDYAQVISLPNPPLEEIAQGRDGGAARTRCQRRDGGACCAAPEAVSGFRRRGVARRCRRGAEGDRARDHDARRARHPDLHQHRGPSARRGALPPGVRRDGGARPADLAASGAHRRDAGLCGGGEIALRDVVVLRLALRDERRDGAARLLRCVRPPSWA